MKVNKTLINTTSTYFLFVATFLFCILFIIISICIKIFRTKNTDSAMSSIDNEYESDHTVKSKCYACEKETCNRSSSHPSKCYDCERKSKSDSTLQYIMKYPTSSPKMTYV